MTMERVVCNGGDKANEVHIVQSGTLHYDEDVAETYGLPEDGHANVYADRASSAIGITLATQEMDATYTITNRSISVVRPVRKAGRDLPTETRTLQHTVENGMFVVYLNNLPEVDTVTTEYQDTL